MIFRKSDATDYLPKAFRSLNEREYLTPRKLKMCKLCRLINGTALWVKVVGGVKKAVFSDSVHTSQQLPFLQQGSREYYLVTRLLVTSDGLDMNQWLCNTTGN